MQRTDISEWKSVITSSSVIFAVSDYVCQRLRNTGKLIICDAPQTDSSFKLIAGSWIYTRLQPIVRRNMVQWWKLLICEMRSGRIKMELS